MSRAELHTSGERNYTQVPSSLRDLLWDSIKLAESNISWKRLLRAQLPSTLKGASPCAEHKHGFPPCSQALPAFSSSLSKSLPISMKLCNHRGRNRLRCTYTCAASRLLSSIKNRSPSREAGVIHTPVHVQGSQGRGGETPVASLDQEVSPEPLVRTENTQTNIHGRKWIHGPILLAAREEVVSSELLSK